VLYHSRNPISVKKARIIVAIAIAGMLVPLVSACGNVHPDDASIVQIGYCSDMLVDDADYLAAQLDLDPRFNITRILTSTLSSGSLASIDILVLAGANLTNAQAVYVEGWTSAGGSTLVMPGSNLTSESATLRALGIMASNSSIEEIEASVVIDILNSSQTVVSGIEWSTAPEIKAYHRITVLATGLVPVLDRTDTGDLLVGYRALGTGRVLSFLVMYTSAANLNFKLWSYTPYFLFKMLSFLSGSVDVPSFASWEYAPVPNTSERLVLVLFLAGVSVFFLVLVIIAKRASKTQVHTNLHQLTQDKGKPLQDGSSASGTVVPGQEATARQTIATDDKWERVGIHRQISSFFMTILTQYMINLPFLFLNIAIYSKYIQPFPMVSGMTSWVGSVLGNVFTILDMGFGSSLAKFFSQHRVRSPVTALKYAQVYTWWCFTVTSTQAIVITGLATFYMPNTYVSAISFYAILASATRIPGFYGVIGAVLDAMQRFDVKIKTNAILGSIVNQFIGWGITIAFREIYKHDARFGEAFGTGVGLYMGGVVNGAINFIIWVLIYKKLGYYPGNLFRIDFGKKEFKESFVFGSKLTIGNFWVCMAAIIEMFLISFFVVNYTEELGAYNFSGYLTGLGHINFVFVWSLMPAISEAIGADKKKLVEYYLIEGLKWIFFFQFFLMGLFCAAGENFLLLAGAQWTGAIKYLYWKLVFFLCWPLAWYADVAFQATGHSGYNTGVWFIEQGTRLFLMPFTLTAFGLIGLVYAYIPGIVAKGFVSLIIIRKKICAFKPQWVHTVFASAASGLLIFAIIFFISKLFPYGDPVAGPIIFFSGFILGLIAHGFFTGVFSGWDKNTIDEFAAGLGMMKWTARIFSPLHKAVALGYRFSPWKERFSVKIFHEAEEEARQLTKEKVSMNA